jgi:ubiquinone/menaquinone biosynthesis C-methylase UbiE
MKKWPVQPVDTIILDLSALPASSVIADIGCGDAKIASELGKQYKVTFTFSDVIDLNFKPSHFSPKVHSFDLVAVNDRVTVANMANLPLENDSVDACVFCLSLMGTNIHHFLREAHRILKMGHDLLSPFYFTFYDFQILEEK